MAVSGNWPVAPEAMDMDSRPVLGAVCRERCWIRKDASGWVVGPTEFQD